MNSFSQAAIPFFTRGNPWALNQVKNLDTPGLPRHINHMGTVYLTPAAAEQFDRLPRPIRARVNRLRERLEQWPKVSGVKALSGDLAGYFRLRTGDYRLRFRLEGKTIIVDKIGHRKEFYDD